MKVNVINCNIRQNTTSFNNIFFKRNKKNKTENADINDSEYEAAVQRGLFNSDLPVQYSKSDIKRLLNIRNSDFGKAKSLLFLKDRGSNQFSSKDIRKLSRIDDEKFLALVPFFAVKERGDEQFAAHDITKFSNLDYDEISRAKTLVFIEGRNRQFNSDEIIYFSKFDAEKFQNAKKYLYIDTRGNFQFSPSDIDFILSAPDDKKEKMNSVIFSKSARGRELKIRDISRLCECSADRIDLVSELLGEKTFFDTYRFSTGDIVSFLNLSDAKLNRAKKYFNVDKRGSNQFYPYEILKLSQLDEDRGKRADELLYIEGRKRMQLHATEIINASNLTGDEFEYLKNEFKNNPDVDFSAAFIGAKFSKYLMYSSLSDMDLSLRREYLKDLISLRRQIFINLDFNSIKNPFFPKDSKDYEKKVQSAAMSCGINSKKIDKSKTDEFFEFLCEMENDKSALNNKDLKISLDYKREDFIYDVVQLLSDLNDADKRKLCLLFGFELVQHDDKTSIEGYPSTDEANIDNIDDNNIKQKAKKLYYLVYKFTKENKVKVRGSDKVSEYVREIIKIFPEFLTTISKKQYGLHMYSLDMHLINTLFEVMNDPDYFELSEKERRKLQLAALFHDISKKEEVYDSNHDIRSSNDAYCILSRLNLKEEDLNDIVNLIKHHEWLKKYNTSKIKDEDVLKDIAFEFRKDNLLLMQTILTKSDMKSIQKDGAFFKALEDVFECAKSDSLGHLSEIKNTAIPLLVTDFINASDIKADNDVVKKIKTKTDDNREIENTVLFLKNGINLSKFGFREGVNSDDLTCLIHGFDGSLNGTLFDAMGRINSDALFSSSFVFYPLKNYHGFRNQGFIINANPDDICAGYKRDFGSGFLKDTDLLKRQYLFGGNFHEARTYISDKIKEIFNLSDEEYFEFYNLYKNKSYFEIKDEKIKDGFKLLFSDIEGRERKGSRKYNEILVINPKISAVFACNMNGDISQIPSFLREYAADNDKLIVYFGE